MMSITSLIEFIAEREPEVTGRDIADAVWLTLTIAKNQLTHTVLQDELSELPLLPTSSFPEQIADSNLETSSGHEFEGETHHLESLSPSAQAQANLYPPEPSDNSNLQDRATPIRTPSVGKLPNARKIARALRPLRRRILSHHYSQLDEKATAERSAEERILIPVMLPTQRRWLSFHMVVDYGGSTIIWRDTVDELYRLLIRQNAFRDIRLWRFNSDSNSGEITLSAGLTSNIARPAKELCASEGNHLVWVVSDCVGRAWYNGSCAKALATWGRTGPVTLLQLMPPQLWSRTALGRATAVRLRRGASGISNSKLLSVSSDAWNEELPSNNVSVPVLTLNSGSIYAWVRMLVGLPEIEVAGFALDSEVKESVPRTSSDGALDAQERVQRFFSLSSPTSQQMALLASAAPVTIPVLNLLRATFLPSAEQSHLAEVLLSGLLYRTSSNSNVASDTVLYEFHDGVRERLLQLAPFNQSHEVLTKVSAYIEEQGENPYEMSAMLGLPSGHGNMDTPRSDPFAHIRETLLRGLGYSSLADILKQNTNSEKEARSETKISSTERADVSSADRRTKIDQYLEQFSQSLRPTEREIDSIVTVFNNLQSKVTGKQGRYQITELVLFGSLARETAIRPVSDVDILVLFEAPLFPNPADLLRDLERFVGEIYSENMIYSPDLRRGLKDARFSRHKGAGHSSVGPTVTLSVDGIRFELVPSVFQRGRGVIVPDMKRSAWFGTGHLLHERKARQLQDATFGQYNHLVRLVKQWHHANFPEHPCLKGFVLECLVAQYIDINIGSISENFTVIIEKITKARTSLREFQLVPHVGLGMSKHTGLTRQSFEMLRTGLERTVKLLHDAAQAANISSELETWEAVFGSAFNEFISNSELSEMPLGKSLRNVSQYELTQLSRSKYINQEAEEYFHNTSRAQSQDFRTTNSDPELQPNDDERQQAAVPKPVIPQLPEIGDIFTGKVLDGDPDVFLIAIPGFSAKRAVALLRREVGVPNFRINKDSARVEVIGEPRNSKSGVIVIEVRRPPKVIRNEQA